MSFPKCQQTKYSTQPPASLLQPIPSPTHVWEDISLDFIVGLSPFAGHTIILVIVDHFSKATHFGMLPSHHGFPHSIISDRDPIFPSGFWKELFRLQGTKLRMSTSYHPQSDGQTEVINHVLEQYLQAFVLHKPKQWGKFLHLA